MSIIGRAAVLLAALAAGFALSLVLHQHSPPSAGVVPDDMPPPGWMEVCDSAAIGFVCRTYPPGDERWQPSPPVPPQRPLPTPWPGGEDAR